jgi:hypothetical protein
MDAKPVVKLATRWLGCFPATRGQTERHSMAKAVDSTRRATELGVKRSLDLVVAVMPIVTLLPLISNDVRRGAPDASCKKRYNVTRTTVGLSVTPANVGNDAPPAQHAT